jgi:hypothetical protein
MKLEDLTKQNVKTVIEEEIKMSMIDGNENTEQGPTNMFEMVDNHDCLKEILLPSNENIESVENEDI